MAKAQIIKTEDRDGRKVNIYDSGMELDAATGHIIRRPDSVAFTPETARLAVRKRQEKYKARLRKGITESTNAGLLPAGTPPVTDAADAFAAAGVQLWEQVVMNSEAYPRDRKETYEMLGKQAGVLTDPRQPGSDPEASRMQAIAAVANADTARTLARILADVKQVQESNVIDGKATE